MDDESIVIKNVRVVYIATKHDKYNNELAYFKIKDNNIDQKFSTIIKVYEQAFLGEAIALLS